MIKLFISQPMRGKTDEEIKATRQKAIDTAKERLGEDVEVIDSFFEAAPHDARPLWFLGKSLQLLSGADVAFFAKGYSHFRGCIMEHEACSQYGISVILEDESEI